MRFDIIRNGLNKINDNKTAKYFLKGNFKKEVMTIAFIGSLSKMKGIYELLDGSKTLCRAKSKCETFNSWRKTQKGFGS